MNQYFKSDFILLQLFIVLNDFSLKNNPFLPETMELIATMIGLKHSRKIYFKMCINNADGTKNMAHNAI